MSAPRPKILVVEDEAIIAMLLEQHLARWGYEVELASTGQMALGQVRSLSPDLVLLDITLRGGLDGIQVAGIIKAEHGIPVVFLTSHSDDTTKARALSTGPAGYLTKPVDERELLATLRLILS